MKLKRKTAKRAGIIAMAQPGKRRAAAKAAKGGAAAARRDARVQALLHDETVHRRLRDGLVNARVVYLRATRRGDAATALLDDRKGRRALRRTIEAFKDASGRVRAANPRRRRRAAARVVVPVVVVGAAGALASSRQLRSKVPGLGADAGDGAATGAQAVTPA